MQSRAKCAMVHMNFSTLRMSLRTLNWKCRNRWTERRRRKTWRKTRAARKQSSCEKLTGEIAGFVSGTRILAWILFTLLQVLLLLNPRNSIKLPRDSLRWILERYEGYTPEFARCSRGDISLVSAGVQVLMDMPHR